jgi:hypothetical protein
MKTKKLPYGEKQARILEVLAFSPDKTDKQIARAVGCAPSYVHYVRTKEYKREAKALEAEGLIQPDDGRVVPIRPEMEPVAEPQGVDAILDERGKRYGNFLDHARVTQRLKNVAHQFASEHNKRFDVDQAEALDMIFHKIGRILNGDPNYADSWIDIAGYAKLVADRLEGVSR